METSKAVIGAFSEEFAERLTGLSRRQLRYWDSTGFFHPGITDENRRLPYSRIYTFRDIVSLRVLARLRNEFKVPLQHLREVAKKLSHLHADKWIRATLYVANRRVIFDNPRTGRREEVVSGQTYLELPLQVVISETKQRIAEAAERPSEQVGKVVEAHFLGHKDKVVAGTRIPIVAIKRFAEAGYSISQIMTEYPGLARADVEAALHYEGVAAA